MQQLITSKINPFLLKTFRNSLVNEIIIEGQKENTNDISNILDTFKMPVLQQSEHFPFTSTFMTPDLMIQLIQQPEITMLHANLPKNALWGLRNPLTFQPPAALINSFLNPMNVFSPDKLISMFSNLPLGIKLMEGENKLLPGEKPYTSIIDSRKLVGAEIAEQEGFTGREVKVAVTDTGVDISANQVGLVDADTVLLHQPNHDENGHGTHCLTTAIGGGDINSRGVKLKGVAPDAEKISIKCLGGLIGTGTTMDVIKAMELAYIKGAKVISMSLGSSSCQGAGPDPCKTCPECRVVNSLKEAGVILVIAAGNSGPNSETIGCPGCSPDALTVGAYDPVTGEIASFSSRGPIHGRIKPDVIAPGVNIYASTSRASLLDLIAGDRLPDGSVAISGTSMATPHIAGLVALLVQKYGRDLTVDQIKVLAKERGQAKNNNSGWGAINWDWFTPRAETVSKPVREEEDLGDPLYS